MSRDPLKLRYYGDPLLRRKAAAVAAVTSEIKELIGAMFECMHGEKGIGLAAPQVGLLKRIFVLDVEEDSGERTKLALVNPVMIDRSGEMVGEEGCLSIPGVRVDVKRFAEVEFEALDELGAAIQVSAKGLLSRVLQHELDHLDGVLIIDRLSAIRRKLIEAKLARMRFGDEDPASPEASATRSL